MNSCTYCLTKFANAGNLKRHYKSVHKIQVAVVPRKGKTSLVMKYTVFFFIKTPKVKQRNLRLGKTRGKLKKMVFGEIERNIVQNKQRRG